MFFILPQLNCLLSSSQLIITSYEVRLLSCYCCCFVLPLARARLDDPHASSFYAKLSWLAAGSRWHHFFKLKQNSEQIWRSHREYCFRRCSLPVEQTVWSSTYTTSPSSTVGERPTSSLAPSRVVEVSIESGVSRLAWWTKYLILIKSCDANKSSYVADK